MKRIVCFILSLVLACTVFSGCESGEKDVDLNGVIEDIKAQVTLPDEMMEITTADLFMRYYGIAENDFEKGIALINSSGVDVTEIVIFKASSQQSTKNIEKALNTRKTAQENAMKNYIPEQYEIIKNCNVLINGNYVAFFAGPETEKIIDIYNSYLE